MVVTDNDCDFYSFLFLESNKKNKCRAFKTDAVVPEKTLEMLLISKIFKLIV